MKSTSYALLSLLLAAPLSSYAEQLIPAGSLIQCTVSEPKLSSKTTAIGDPVLCQLGHSERYGRSVLPINSYLVGRFEDYKDPGHFVGKGWMELRFDRMVIEPDTVIPVDARVVAVPGYNVDRNGRILGKGHAVRDAVLWSIPILWPVDLIMLPMRGPRPTLKEETRMTLKVMDDLAIPDVQQPQRDPYGLMQRPPVSEAAPPPPMDQQPPAPETADYEPQPAPAPAPAYADAPPPPPVYAYAPPPPPVYAYGVGAVIGGYAGGGYAGGGYGGGGYARGNGYGAGAAVRPYRPAPRAYAYNGPPRAYPQGANRPAYPGTAHPYAGMQRAYAAAPRGYAAAPRGYSYGGGARMSSGGGMRGGGGGGARRGR
ncbi:MAG: hypothetical protein ABSG51_16775 [Terracidiphilus sp.]